MKGATEIRLNFSSLIATLIFAACTGAHAEWPEMPIKILIPFSPGGTTDAVLRPLIPLLQARLGRPVIVDYRPGAGGNIAFAEVARAKPDGYTLMLSAANNFVINQFLYKNFPYDPQKDLTPISKIVDVPPVIYTNADVPAKTYKEFAAYAKANAGRLNYGSPGVGTTPHLGGFLISESIGANMTHIAYRGSQPATLALLSNDVQMYLVSYGSMAAQLKAGKVRALAVASQTRMSQIPDVPTTKEVGAPNILSNWFGLAGPKGMDPAIVRKLANEFRYVVQSVEVAKQLDDQGFTRVVNSPEEFAQDIQRESTLAKALVDRSGATAE